MKKVRSKLRPTEIGVIKTFSLSPDDEIGEIAVQCSGCTYYYNNLSELCEKWEDYEEPSKTIWQIKDSGELEDFEEDDFSDGYIESSKSIGNYFETKEEADKAVEKLKAWKRLEDKGFRFDGWTIDDGLRISICTNTDENDIYDEDKRRIKPDIDLLFGGCDG